MEDSTRGSQVPAVSSNKAVKLLLHEQACPREKWVTNTQNQTGDPFLAQPEPTQQATALETQYSQIPGAMQAQKCSFLTIMHQHLEVSVGTRT